MENLLLLQGLVTFTTHCPKGDCAMHAGDCAMHALDQMLGDPRHCASVYCGDHLWLRGLSMAAILYPRRPLQ